MKKLIAAYALVCAFSLFAQAPKMMDAPAYQLGKGTNFDMSPGVVRLPVNLGQLFSLPIQCKPGQVQITAKGVFFCGGSADSPSWIQLAIADGSGKVPLSALPTIDQLLGVLRAGQLPTTIDSNTTGNAATATALAHAPKSCGSGIFATGITSTGDCVGSPVGWSQLVEIPSLVLRTEVGASNGVAALGPDQRLISGELPSIPWTLLSNVPLANIAYSGKWADIINPPSIPSKLSQLTNDTGLITAAQAPVTSVNTQTGDVTLSIPSKLSQLTNDPGYVTALQASSAAPVQSVNGATGAVTIAVPTDDAQLANGAGYVTAGQTITSILNGGNPVPHQQRLNFIGPLQAINNAGNNSTDVTISTTIPTKTSQIQNDSGFVDANGAKSAAPVQSVNGQTGSVVLSIPADDAQLSNGANYITAGQAPVQSVNSQTGAVTIAVPTKDSQLANDAGYITSATAPVTSVNGLIGAVTLDIPVKTSQLANDAGFVNAIGAAAAAPVQSVNGATGAVAIALPTKTSQLANDSGFITAAGALSTVENAGHALGLHSTINFLGPLQAVENVGSNSIDISLSAPIPTKLSDLTNDSGFITASQAPVQSVNGATGNVVLAIPTKDSQLTNDAGFVTAAQAASAAPVQSVNGATGAVTVNVPTDDSQLSNTAGYITAAQVAANAPVQSVNGQAGAVAIAVPSKTSDLTNDSGFITSAAVTAENAGSALSNKRTIFNFLGPLQVSDNAGNGSFDVSLAIPIPTNNNQLTNGAGYVTAAQSASAAPVQSVNGSTGAVTVVVPTDDAQLANGAGYLTAGQAITTVQSSGAGVAREGKLNFLGPLQASDNAANGSTDVSLATPIPTKTSQLTNDANFVTVAQAAAAAPVQSVNGSTGAVTIAVPTKTSQLSNDAGFIIASQVPVQSVNGQTGVVTIAVPTDDSQLANGAGYITAASAPVISVNGATGAVTVNVPTALSQLTNDTNFITSAGLAPVAFSGDYNQLVNKPTGLPPSGPAGGDLGGTYPNPTVRGINGQNMAALGAGILCNSAAGVPGLCGSSAIAGAIGFTPENVANKGATNGYTPLVNGTVPTQYLPPQQPPTSAQVVSALGFTPENSANKGAAGGYAPLAQDDKVPAQYLPAQTLPTAAQIDQILGYTPLNPTALGVANGIATLDQNGTLTSSQMPAITLTKAQVLTALGYTPIDQALIGVANGVAALGNTGTVPDLELLGMSAADITHGAFPGSIQIGTATAAQPQPACDATTVGTFYNGAGNVQLCGAITVGTTTTYKWASVGNPAGGNQETRHLQVSTCEPGGVNSQSGCSNLPGGGSSTIFGYSGGPGSASMIQLAVTGGSIPDATLLDSHIVITTDGNVAVDAPLGIFMEWYANTPPFDSANLTVTQSDEPGCTTPQCFAAGSKGGFRRLLIPWKNSVSIVVNNAGGGSALIFSQVYYRIGQHPIINSADSRRNVLHSYTIPCCSSVGSYGAINALPTVTLAAGQTGVIDSVNFFAYNQDAGQNVQPTWLEGNPSFQIDGQPVVFGGTEDTFYCQYYCDELNVHQAEAGMQVWMSGDQGNPNGTAGSLASAGYHFFHEDPILFEISASLTMYNGQSGQGANAPGNIGWSTLVIYYTSN